MSSQVLDRELAEAIDAISAGFDALFAAGLAPVDDRDAVTVAREVEVLGRRADAMRVAVLAAIDSEGMFRADGHGSAKIMIRHLGKLSNGEAAARDKAARVCRGLPSLGEAHRAGAVGSDQVGLLGRVHSNRRVRDEMVDAEEWFLARAGRCAFREFEVIVRRWEELTDTDGADPACEAGFENRDAQLVQDFNKSWDLRGRFGCGQGAAMDEIFRQYINAELLSDWEKARAEHGDQACTDHLARTSSQRRADAVWQLFQDAASSPAGAAPPGFVHNIVWDYATFEEMAARAAGDRAHPLDVDSHRCETLDGIQLDAFETWGNALVNQIRRVLINAKGTVIDLGEARFFTGNARHAVKLAATQCTWVACDVASSDCEADHLLEHSQGGLTKPDNGAPACGKHNRWKQKGFRIWRDPTGAWHTYRPDGTEIP